MFECFPHEWETNFIFYLVCMTVKGIMCEAHEAWNVWTATSAYNWRNAWHHVRKCMTIMNGLRPWSAAVSWPRRFFTLRGLIAMQLVWTYLRLTRSCTGYATLFGNEVDVIQYKPVGFGRAAHTRIFRLIVTKRGRCALPPPPSAHRKFAAQPSKINDK